MLELLKEFVDEQDLHLYKDDTFDNDLSNEDTSPEYIEKLHDIIKKQKHLIKKLCDTLQKLKVRFSLQTSSCYFSNFIWFYPFQKTISTCDTNTQTETETKSSPSTDTIWKTERVSVEDMVKEAAEDAMKQTGFVYESTSGLYYDYNTGYYYNAVSYLWVISF